MGRNWVSIVVLVAVFASKPQSVDNANDVQQQQQQQQLQQQQQQLQQQQQGPLFSPFTAPDPRQNEVGVDHLFSNNLRPTKAFSPQPVEKHTTQFQLPEPYFGKAIPSLPVQKNKQQFVQPQPLQSVQKYTPQTLQKQFVQSPSVQLVQQN